MITTLLMAMVPVIELRGAIPYGVAVAGLEIWQAALIAVIGNLLPIPFLVVFTRDVFAWMRKKSERLDRIVVRMEKKADKNKDVVLRYQFWGLMILVAIPLPGTGAWTGALVAALMDLQLKRAMPAIALGVVIAAIIVTWITYGASVFL
ncbi:MULTISPECIES: COG2426 family protein [Mogibacterium]|uniref:Small multi-drug export protein n=2 Tax=Mogibacterium timidum TaxID=35519 RepID=A0A7Y9B1R3_9FIRM|nr:MULTISPECIES: small multi-drug export protein [Mogibacterium]EJU19139.1 putative small multi-drug export protein [Mogibacterium sp. CM50]EUC52235.1 putative small multi-drug export protein [Mogibacterium timidum ATCC 33093]NWO23796.1 small multi-drug export protein [Mogibacterium timidum]